MTRRLVLLNASAGTAAQFDGQDLARRIDRAFAEAGQPAEIRPVAPNELNGALALARKAERPIVIAGGDGSVSAAIQVFAGTGIPLAVLPFGTYNLLAHDLGMSDDLEESVRAIALGEARPIDLGRVAGRYFHTLAGLGFFSRVARQRARIRARLPGAKAVGALVAAFRSLTTSGNLHVEIDDGIRRERFRTPAVLITNNLMQERSWRRPRLDEAVFEINVARGDVPFPLLRGGMAAVFGGWRESEDIVTWKAPRAVLRFRRPRVFLSLDGEVLRPRTPLVFESVRGALTCIMARPVSDSAGEEASPR